MIKGNYEVSQKYVKIIWSANKEGGGNNIQKNNNIDFVFWDPCKEFW